MKTKALFPFLAIFFGITWGLAALLMLFYDQMIAIFGEMSIRNPLFILFAYSPGIAGILLVWRNYELKGLGRFFQRLTLWRAPAAWWAFLILGIPLVVYSGAAIKGSITELFPSLRGIRCSPQWQQPCYSARLRSLAGVVLHNLCYSKGSRRSGLA